MNPVGEPDAGNLAVRGGQKPASGCSELSERAGFAFRAFQWALFLCAPLYVLVRNVQELTARLAVHRVRVMPQESTLRTLEADLVRAQHRAREPKKQCDTKNHNNYRNQPPNRARQGDIAESGSGQGGYGELERVRIVANRRIDQVLCLVHEAGHHEQEYCEIGDRKDQILTRSVVWKIGAQPHYDLIAA
jgi:hypothetical protein